MRVFRQRELEGLQRELEVLQRAFKEIAGHYKEHSENWRDYGKWREQSEECIEGIGGLESSPAATGRRSDIAQRE
jgi:hypothetical protein